MLVYSNALFFCSSNEIDSIITWVKLLHKKIDRLAEKAGSEQLNRELQSRSLENSAVLQTRNLNKEAE